MKIDHIGYAVKRINRAKETFEKLGFIFEPMIEDTDRNIKIAFGEKDGYRIELVSPLKNGGGSPVDTYLSSVGCTPYHICYESEQLDQDIEDLKRQGFKVVIEPKAAVAFGGKRVVFMININLGLMEIVES